MTRGQDAAPAASSPGAGQSGPVWPPQTTPSWTPFRRTGGLLGNEGARPPLLSHGKGAG